MRRDVAVALGYQAGTASAPKVLGRGEGLWAEQIRQLAEQHGIALHHDGDLAELLGQLPIESEIPPELYPAIAEIFAFLYNVAKKQRASL